MKLSLTNTVHCTIPTMCILYVYSYCIPLHLLQPWQAGFLCRDSDYFCFRISTSVVITLSFHVYWRGQCSEQRWVTIFTIFVVCVASKLVNIFAYLQKFANSFMGLWHFNTKYSFELLSWNLVPDRVGFRCREQIRCRYTLVWNF